MIRISDHYSPNFHEPHRTAQVVMHAPLVGLAGGWVAVDTSPTRRGTWSEPQIAPGGNRSVGYLVAKRSCDLAGALGLLLLLSPLMIVTWLALLVTTRGKPFFRQQREGFCGTTFWMWKFRTMVNDAEARLGDVANEHGGAMFKNRADPRITRLGKFLRAFSIDETPQLFNVLRGEMSLVGPRPMVAGHAHHYRGPQARRLAVLPGLTGLWQVSGRTKLGFEQMVDLDLRYIAQQSLVGDLQLLVRTPWVVITRKGAC